MWSSMSFPLWEDCPDISFCQQCGSEKNKNQQADMIMFVDYKDIELDESPVIILQCGHIFTYETLDGTVELGKFYSKAEKTGSNGIINHSNSLSIHKLAGCSLCRTPFTSINRYKRV